MNIQETVKLTGHINFKLFDANGNLKEERNIKNVITTVGKAYMATWLAAATQSDYFMKYVGLGTGNAAASAADTDLQTPLPTREIATITAPGGAVWQSVSNFGAGVNTGAITESGIFSASSGGTLMARQTFTVINKGASDTLQVTWQITIS